MATRMQQRRGTAQQWTTANPILASGEIGFESDTSKFKIGDGVNHWEDLVYYASAEELSSIIDGAPDLLNTLNELAAALGDDPAFFTTVATNLSNHQTDTTNIHGIVNTEQLSLKSEVTTEIGSAVSTHNLDTTLVHGIEDTTVLVTQTELADAISTATVDQESLAGVGIDWNTETDQYDIDSTVATKTYVGTEIGSAVSTHNTDTANVHGIADTSLLSTREYADGAVSTHSSDTTSVHGIADTSALALTATVATDISTAVSTHNNDTTSVHGIADTADLLLKSGGTMTGALTLSADPSSSLHAATKQYVDNTASGVIAKPQVLGATTANIAATYNNGTAGVGATLTHNTNGAFPAEAGGASGWAVGKGILVKNQTNKAENGRYYISDMGSASTPYVLTRCSYCDEASEIPGAYIFVQDGTFAGTGWIQVVADPATFVVGTDNIDVFQFSGSGTITAGTNISVSGNEVSVVATPSLSGVAFTDGTQTKEGVPSRTPIVQKTASYALSTLTHRDSMIEVSSASATTITIPLDSTVNYPIGTTVDILQTNTGQVTIAGAAGVTVNATPGLKLRTRWSSCTLMKRAANTWVVYGDLTA